MSKRFNVLTIKLDRETLQITAKKLKANQSLWEEQKS